MISTIFYLSKIIIDIKQTIICMTYRSWQRNSSVWHVVSDPTKQKILIVYNIKTPFIIAFGKKYNITTANS
jgi:hypothetical protein